MVVPSPITQVVRACIDGATNNRYRKIGQHESFRVQVVHATVFTLTLTFLVLLLRSLRAAQLNSAVVGRESCILKYRKILLSCAFGQVPGSLSTVGLSTDRQLAIHWRCPTYNREMHVFKSLARVLERTPK
jgi:hypothetical protein